MKSGIRKNGSISKQICILTLFLLLSLGQIDYISALRLGILNEQRLLSHNHQQQHLRNKSRNRTQHRGIVDLAVAKIDREEKQQTKQIEAINLKAQDNFLKATRQAILLTGSNNNLEDADQVMKNMRMAQINTGQADAVETNEYNQQINKIASQQEDYKDEYEGFGSLTEMIKNTDKIAEKEASDQLEKDKVKKEAEDKIQNIKAAKSKMTEALNNASKKKKEKKIPQPSPASSNTTNKEQPQKQAEQSQAQNSTEKSKSSKQEEVGLSDTQVAQVIDEVQGEQDKPEFIQPISDDQAKEQSDPNDQFRGFIGRFTSKFKKDDKPEEEAQNLNVQTAEEETPKPKKGMFARFQEQIHQDEADSEKAKEVVLEYQHAMDIPNKSILDRETERLVQEQDDEYALEADLASPPDG